MSRHTRRIVLFAIMMVAFWVSGHAFSATPPEGFDIKKEAAWAIKEQGRSSYKRRMHAALMLREQGLLGEAYRSMVYMFPEERNSGRQAGYLFMAGLLAYEISGYQDPNSYAWRLLIEEIGDDPAARRAWEIIERHVGRDTASGKKGA